jgi:hypothetical protein
MLPEIINIFKSLTNHQIRDSLHKQRKKHPQNKPLLPHKTQTRSCASSLDDGSKSSINRKKEKLQINPPHCFSAPAVLRK